MLFIVYLLYILCSPSDFYSLLLPPQVMGSDGPLVVLATSTEEELAQWMAALCQAAIEEVREGGERRGGRDHSSSYHSILLDSISIIIPFHGGQLPFHSMVINLHPCRLPLPRLS